MALTDQIALGFTQVGSTIKGVNTTVAGKYAKPGTGIPESDLDSAVAAKLNGGVLTVNGRGGAVTLTKTDVGLGNVDNTADSAKPVSSAQQTALNDKQDLIAAGTTAQYYRGDKAFVTLDKVAVGLGNVDNIADSSKAVLSATKLTTARTINGVSFDGTANITIPTVDSTKEPVVAAGTVAQYYRGDKNWATLDKASVGLGSVDNTADSAKAVASAAKLTTARTINTVAFDGTANITIPTPPGDPGPPGSPGGIWYAEDQYTAVHTAVPDPNLGDMFLYDNGNIYRFDGATWYYTGNIVASGSGSDPTKEPIITPGTTAQYWRGDKTWQALNATAVGLANVTNTADSAKPVSTAQQAALDLKASLASPTFTGTVSGVTKAMVGLANVDNTSDAAKPVSTAQQTAINGREPTVAVGTTAQYWRGDKTWVNLDKVAVGLGNVDNTSDAAKPISTAEQTALNLKAPLASPTFTGTVSGVTKAMVGLGNADNTADTAKPISTAQQTALDLKAPLASPAFTGTPTGINKSHVGLSNVDNTADASKVVASAAKLTTARNINGVAFDGTGNITIPTTDATKEPIIVAGTTAQYWRGDKSWAALDKIAVGLPNADNTSDANKPVSSATQAALNLLAPKASPTFTGTVTGVTKAMVGLGSADDTADANKSVLSATKLTTARTINGVPFDGTAPITVADSTKEPTIVAGTTVQYYRGDKSWQTLVKADVGLGSVDNTADAAKNVLSAAKLTTARTINGVSFDGTTNITVADATKEPALPGGGTTTHYLRGDKSWQTLNAAAVGLANVTNTSDVSKPVSTAQQAALDLKEDKANRGAASGYAPLDANSLVPSIHLPSYVDDVEEYASLAAFPGTGTAGKIYVTADTNKTYRWSGTVYVEISASPGSTDAVPEGSTNLYYTAVRASGAAPVQSVATKTGVVTLVKADVGLGSVDNTADAAKNVLSATKLTTPRAINGVNFDGTAAITVADATKEPSLPAGGTTAHYLRGDKTWVTLNATAVGLGSVNNTADSAKPVSTATQTQLDLKAPLASPAFTGTPTGITKTHVGLGSVDNTADIAKNVLSATKLTTARTINGTSFDGTANITITDATKEPALPVGGTTAHYLRGDKAWTALNAAAVGLGNVVNTNDADKPVSTATQAALDLKAPIASPTFTGTVGGITKTMIGLPNVDNTADSAKAVLSATKLATARTINAVLFDGTTNITIPAVDATKEPIIAAGTTAQYWRGDKTWVALDKAAVGLGSVDNTADSAKNVLSATKLTTARTINGVSFDGTGNITVVDSTKEPIVTAGTTAQYWRGDKSWQTLDKTAVGLGSVDNTADTAKPVSTAQTTAINTAVATKVNGSVNGVATLLTLWTGTQAQYDAIGVKDGSTVYVVV